VDKTNVKATATSAARRHPPRGAEAGAGRTLRHPLAAGFRPAGVALALAAAFVPYGDVLAQPAGAQVIHGQASLQQQGNSLLVTTQNGPGSRHSAINWQSFSVPGGSVTHFRQPDAASTSINRVLGNNPSAIFGTLSSNGRLVVVNPSGIAVGAGAVVDTAGFTASTLRMSDADALAGRLMFAGGGAGVLKVDGTVIARQGDAVFIAPQVQVGSAALVQAPNGATLLAAGQSVEVTGRGLEGIRLHLQAPADRAVNLGTLQGDAVAIFAGQLQHRGLVQATGVTIDGGKVVLKATGAAEIAGTVSATQGNKGGQVHATAADLTVRGGALLDVSGQAGGGEALLGGGWQGKDARIANAQRTTIETGAQVKADGIASGDGGTIVAWSDGATRVQGMLSARGGAAGGDGGMIETSGHYLDMRGQVDTRAPKGRTGSLLLDPTNVYVSETLPDGAASESLLLPSVLKSSLETAAVTLTAAKDGANEGYIKVLSLMEWATPHGLTLTADGQIAINAESQGHWDSVDLTLDCLRAPSSQTEPITAPTLLAVSREDSVTLNNAGNKVGTLAGSAAAGGFAFTNSQGLTVGTIGSAEGIFAPNQAFSLKTEAGDLMLHAPVAGSTVLLKSAASITQDDGATIHAQTLTVRAGGNVDLSAASNQVAELAGGAWTEGADRTFTFSNSKDLIIGSGQDGAETVKGIEVSFTDRANGGRIGLKASGSLTQETDGDLRGSEVFADGTAVDLTAATNPTGIVAGSATDGDFNYKSANQILVSTVGGYSGIGASGAVALTSANGVQIEQPIAAASIALKSTGTGADVSVAADLTAAGSGGIVISSGKDVRFEGSEAGVPTVRSEAGAIAVTAAAGAITGAADFWTRGGISGTVTFQAKDDVSFGTVDTNGWTTDAAGGAVNVTSTAGSIIGHSINAGGGAGADGGTVNVTATAGTKVDLYYVESSGGYSSETAGGDGGTVTIKATSGSVVIGDGLLARRGRQQLRRGRGWRQHRNHRRQGHPARQTAVRRVPLRALRHHPGQRRQRLGRRCRRAHQAGRYPGHHRRRAWAASSRRRLWGDGRPRRHGDRAREGCAGSPWRHHCQWRRRGLDREFRAGGRQRRPGGPAVDRGCGDA